MRNWVKVFLISGFIKLPFILISGHDECNRKVDKVVVVLFFDGAELWTVAQKVMKSVEDKFGVLLEAEPRVIG